MPSANFTFYQDFKEQLGKKEHNLSSDVIKIALTNTAPNAGTHTVLADITQILGECAVNIEAIIQKEPRGSDAANQRVPIIILTRELLEETMNTAIARIEQLDCVAEKVTRIRVFKIE